MAENALFITLLPLLSFIIIVFLTKRAKMVSALVALTAVGTSALLSVRVLINMLRGAKPQELSVDWLNIPSMGAFKGLKIQMGILVDPLSSLMLVIVTFVATLVILYSIGYMKGDNGFSRYFAYISLFTFSMLVLVISSNYFQMFAGWELVGLCSYLLIGFWFHKPAAANASKKAFITNRWADFGFMIGIILLFVKFGTFNFGELAALIEGSKGTVSLILIAALIFIGPIGKSAQFPLHVWLPDAMEGPTPVSALIHAATMVAAGVYLIARGFILFESANTILLAMAYIGGFTAIFAASIAIVQKDIKRILAFSTLSQLGYMVMAMGLGSLTAGMFHLTTHAFFKALLFLGAGSVIHAVEEQNIFKMGALKKKMPITTWTFVIGSFALAGIFPLSGFWSKDEILSAALSNGHIGLYIIGTVVAFMTAFYMFRLIFVAFFGKKRSEYHAHESGWVMTLPLIILAILSIFSGFINSPWFYNTFGQSFGTFIFFGEAEIPQINMIVASISTIAALSGIFTAWLLYYKEVVDTKDIVKRWNGLYNLLYNKFYVDEIYSWIFNNVMIVVGKILDWIDHKLIDEIFDGFAKLLGFTGKKARVIQTGYLQSYALVIFTAVVIIVIVMSTPLLGGVFK
ncbi:NADH-quinone oxidoreductase subunit L [Desnuesiella massiliensis]|uniref:NADH-quinone oxidoreductase subunit L n=1 Tax=Desnuesiella massiliensis TaxID=1650662 RepID=UPI0006E3D84F|nr:NADH-quinone oxidoreductase subunit L [Desnuesiella massiliensis]